MPELPEVETVARLIRPGMEGRAITGVSVGWVRTLGGASKARFGRAVVGTRVRRVWRRGKYIVFDLDRDGDRAGALVGHLRMSGRMHVEAAGWDPGPHGRVRMDLDDGREFHFIDVRKFGRLVWTADAADLLDDLGPEPLSETFTEDWLACELRARRRLVKPLLLDQSFLAGLGNIYVDESLFHAGIHPLRRADSLPRKHVARLHGAIRRVLEAAIEREGSSFDTFYRTPTGQPGSYQHQFQVYGREGQSCHRCGRAIRRLVVGQRGTHVCTRCQPAPRRRV
jgi:formamidopyrimidine-DNA glycosylase